MAANSEPVKLAHITTVPQSLNFTRGQVGYMRDRGFVVHAISSPGDRLEAFATEEQVQAHAVEMQRKITPVKDTKALGRLVRVLRRVQPDIVHAHTPKGGLLGTTAAWMAKVPVRIYHIRGLPYLTATGSKRKLLRATERVSCQLADRVFCVSHSIRDVAIADGLVSPDKIIVFGGGSGNGVDATGRYNPDRFSAEFISAGRAELGIRPNDTVVGFVGRIVQDKGIYELAAAWRSIRATYPETHLVLVGSIEEQDPVDPAIVAELREDSRVHFTGRVEDTSKFYALFDLVVLPTYREGFGTVNIEAAAMGLPVVSTRIPGCIDSVKDGITGTLVSPKDAEALRAAIELYLKNQLLGRQHGHAGRERALKEFRQEDIWKAIYDEYVRLLRERGIELTLPRLEASTR